jgi:flagellar basal body-associated protein FliL
MDDKKDKKDVKNAPAGAKKPAISPKMIGGGILVIAVLVIGGIFAMKAMSGSSDAAENKADAESTSDQAESKKAVEYKSTGVYYGDFDAFITVLSQSEEYSFTYLKFVPKFELSDQKVVVELTSKLPQVEDKIGATMTDLDWSVVKSEKGRDKQAEKLREKLNELLETGEIIKIYFTTFVAQ